MKISKSLLMISLVLLPNLAFGAKPGALTLKCPDSGSDTGKIMMKLVATGGFSTSQELPYNEKLTFNHGYQDMGYFRCRYTNSSGERVELEVLAPSPSSNCQLSGENDNTLTCL